MASVDDEVRQALDRLEQAIARHEARLRDAAGKSGADPLLGMLKQSLDLMRGEALRLRGLLRRA